MTLTLHPGARPMHPDWARSLRDQCVAAQVPFFFKQWGAFLPAGQESPEFPCSEADPDLVVTTPMLYDPLARIGKKRAGRLLDGREWNEMPGVTRA